VFGATHAGTAAYLLACGDCRLPLSKPWRSTTRRRKASLRAFGPLTAVHVANVLEQEQAWSESHGRSDQLDAGYLAAIGVQDSVESWRTEAAKLLNCAEGEMMTSRAGRHSLRPFAGWSRQSNGL